MDREIRFRGWHKEEEKMIRPPKPWDSSIGPYYLDLNGHCYINGKLQDIEWMQFTGREDKHDKEIYEGDIIIGEYASMTEEDEFIQAEIKGLVEFFKAGFDVKFLNKEERFGKEAVNDPRKITEDAASLSLIGRDTIEILGNKFENPSLLPGNDNE